jgi:pyruvate kinase
MKTKIIATYGPGIDNDKTLARIIRGVDIFRLNLSHGSPDQWHSYIERIRRVSGKMHEEVALLADLPGPKIRIGTLDAEIEVKPGETVSFAYGKSEGSIPLEYNLYPELKVGLRISLGDGYMRLVVTGLRKGRIYCRALNAGIIKSRKGVNVSGGLVGVEPPTEEDIRLISFARREGFDFVAASFVRHSKNIEKIRRLLGGEGIVAKIERKVAVDKIRSIADASDAIMVARGDLAFDIAVEKVPIAQRKIISAAREAGKPVIVATQMLASMTENPMPTRAEVNDIANAVFEGADCLMLSEETAVGKYPHGCISVMRRTAEQAERSAAASGEKRDIKSIEEGIAFAASSLSQNYMTECIFAPTQTGYTPARLAALRPKARVIALSDKPEVRRKMRMYYGIESRAIGRYSSVDRMLDLVKGIADDMGLRRYLVISGSPNVKGSTDTLKYIYN